MQITYEIVEECMKTTRQFFKFELRVDDKVRHIFGEVLTVNPYWSIRAKVRAVINEY